MGLSRCGRQYNADLPDMGLLPGTRVGPYKIVAAIGAGGIGEVYKARDTRLKRDVAIKALPETFAGDPERLARFQREAEILASLNHPHIADIHGLEEAGPVRALVMEFVDGEDLAQKIARGPIELDQAQLIAGQIAEALEAAHECGIIHRDLKPANIKITPAGDVKVLDFGLAKATEGESRQDLANSPTITSASTRLGVILGTAAYMAPEQAKGKALDKRADIWAFGCVLFEMLSGRPAFAGDTATEVVANVLTRQPQWDALPVGLPEPIQRVIRRCLKKDPKQRLRDIGDARAEIEEASSNHAAPPGMPERVSTGADSNGSPSVPVAGRGRGSDDRRGLGRPIFPTIDCRDDSSTCRAADYPIHDGCPSRDLVPIALSPDGRQLVYRVDGRPARLYIRPLNGFEPRPLAGTEEGADPFFSPDGQRVGFSADGKLKSVSVADGGMPQIICDLPVNRNSDGADWQRDGTIFFSVRPSGGSRPPAARRSASPRWMKKKGEIRHLWPQILPGEKAVLFTVLGAGSDHHIALWTLETHNRSDLMKQRTYAKYASTGHLIYSEAPQYFTRESSGSLLASAFDLKTLKVAGSELPMVENVWVSENSSAQFALSTSGTLVYALFGARGPRTLAWVDRQARPTPLPTPARHYNYPRLSPDEYSLALSIVDGRQTDVWTYDLRRNIPTRVTSDGTSDWAIWRPPDGTSLVDGSRRPGPLQSFYIQNADGTGEAVRLAPSENGQLPSSLSSNGNVLFSISAVPQVMPGIRQHCC